MTPWMHTVVQWPLSVSVGGVFLLAIFLPWFLVTLVRRLWPHPIFKENNELVGFCYGVYGLVYGVLLAFTIVVAWERFADTEQLVMHESTLLSEVWRNSLDFPPAIRNNLHADLMAYTRSVINEEWRSMAIRGEANPGTEAIYERLWALTYHIDPQTKSQEAFLSQLLERMNDLSGARRLRILYSRGEIHGALWLVLLIGAIPMVSFPLLFSSKHAFVQMGIMGSVMVIVLLGLLVALFLQHPFTGPVRLEPVAMQDLLQSFHHRLSAESIIGP